MPQTKGKKMDFGLLKGKVLTEIIGSVGDDEIRFETQDGET